MKAFFLFKDMLSGVYRLHVVFVRSNNLFDADRAVKFGHYKDLRRYFKIWQMFRRDA